MVDNEEKKEKKIRWVERVDNKLDALVKASEKEEKQKEKHIEKLNCLEKKLGRLTGAVIGWYVFLLFIGGLVAWLFRVVAGITAGHGK